MQSATSQSTQAAQDKSVDSFLAAGFETQHFLEIVQAIARKAYSNYVNHLTATEVDVAFADYKVAG